MISFFAHQGGGRQKPLSLSHINRKQAKQSTQTHNDKSKRKKEGKKKPPHPFFPLSFSFLPSFLICSPDS